MKKQLLVSFAALALSCSALAVTANCVVTSGTVLTARVDGSYRISGGRGTSTGGATGVISCPGISVAPGTVVNQYRVLATVSYGGGSPASPSPTQVQQTLTLVGGALNGSSVTATISGGATPSSVVPGVPFQIGSTLNGLVATPAFTVNVTSTTLAGSTVVESIGQVYLSYEIGPIPKTLPENLACASGGIDALASTSLAPSAAKSKVTLQNLLNTATAYQASSYSSLSLAAVRSALVLTDGCARRGSPDVSGAADLVTECNAQAPIYACLKDAETQLAAPRGK